MNSSLHLLWLLTSLHHLTTHGLECIKGLLRISLLPLRCCFPQSDLFMFIFVSMFDVSLPHWNSLSLRTKTLHCPVHSYGPRPHNEACSTHSMVLSDWPTANSILLINCFSHMEDPLERSPVEHHLQTAKTNSVWERHPLNHLQEKSRTERQASTSTCILKGTGGRW